MSFYPSLTSYQIPFEPLINTTRQQIERSLFSLQQKLRRRKQIDLQTQIHLEAQLYKPVLQPNYYEVLRNAEERDIMQNHLAEEEIYRNSIINNIHLNRIEELKFERDQLAKQNVYTRTYSVPVNMPESISPSDEELIRKYQNGSKAIQYYRDLQKQQSKNNRPQQKIHEQMQNVKIKAQKQLFQSQSKGSGILSLQSAKPKFSKSKIDTPYDHIRYPVEELKQKKIITKSGQKQKLAKQLQKEFTQIQHNQQKKHIQSVFKITEQQTTKRDASPVNFLQNQSPYRQSIKRYSSMGRMPCNRSRMNLSPNQRNIINQPYLKPKSLKPEVKLTVKQIQIEAIKKIQNRLKVSKVIYQDSQYSNVKYEGNHLFNTFQMQLKQRNQVREKINGHPVVLKKHALIIQ